MRNGYTESKLLVKAHAVAFGDLDRYGSRANRKCVQVVNRTGMASMLGGGALVIVLG